MSVSAFTHQWNCEELHITESVKQLQLEVTAHVHALTDCGVLRPSPNH